MPRKVKTYERQLADTIADLTEKGKYDITTKQLAKAHFGKMTLGKEIKTGLVRRLPTIKTWLEKDHGIKSCLVTDYYIEVYAKAASMPTKTSEARRCVAGIGPASKGTALHVLNGGNDLVWRESINANLERNAGGMNKNINRTVDAVGRGQLAVKHGQKLTRGAIRSAIPRDLPEPFTPQIEHHK